MSRTVVLTMSRFRATVALCAILAVPQVCLASPSAALPSQCMQSFAVKDKSFTSRNATISCKRSELRREDLFAKIAEMNDTGEIDGTALAAKLLALEATLKKQEDATDWIGLSAGVTGNVLATISVGACMLPPFEGCALAAVGKVLSLVGLIDTAASEADRKKAASNLRGEIAALRVSVSGKKSQAKAARDRLIAEFTQLCNDVRQQCL